MSQHKVVVVGAGTAGLSAARYLLDHTNFEVTVLEADDRYGGRIWSYEAPEHPGKPAELGALMIECACDKQPVYQYCVKNKLNMINYSWNPDKTSHMYFGNATDVKVEFPKIIKHVEHFIDKLEDCDLSTRWTEDSSLPDVPLMEALQANNKMNSRFQKLTPHEKEVFIWLMEADYGDKLQLASVRLFDGIPGDAEIEIDSEVDKVVPQGYKTFLNSLINTGSNNKKVNVILSQHVDSIKVEGEKKVIIKSKDGKEYEADYALVTVPIGVLKAKSIQFSPSLPDAQLAAIENIGFGNLVKALLVFDKQFWPSQSSRFVFFPTDDQAKAGLMRMHIINVSDINGLPALLVGLVGKNADDADKLSDVELKEQVIKVLKVIFPTHGDVSSGVVHFKRTNWRSNPLIGGVYSFGKIGMKFQDAHEVRRPLGSRVFFGGEHTMFPEDQMGTVHGAFMSGERAALELMHAAGMK